MPQDRFLDELCGLACKARLYLTNGVKLEGTVTGYDGEVVLLRGNITQLVYKRAIASIVPLETHPPKKQAKITVSKSCPDVQEVIS